MTTPVRILIVDDHPTLRRGLAQLMRLEDDLEPVGEASSGQEAVELALRLEPDLILLDLHMPGMDGFATISALRDAECDARIVVFTVSEANEDVVRALGLGADGYLLKDMEPEALLEHIRAAVSGKLPVHPRLTEALALALRKRDRRPDLNSLTSREQQVLRLIAAGLTNKMIARRLDIAEGTVKVHVKRLLQKMQLRSRVEAAVWLAEHKSD